MFKIPAKIEYVIETLQKNGFSAYIVGGCVRDILLGVTPHDYDITTSATPEQVMAIFKKTIPTGIKHGTVTVLIEKEPIEVTTFRIDGDYTDSRHPDSVEFVTSLKKDLARRDFTVNAMAYNHCEGVIDYFGGQNDLKNGILRAVGDPEKRFLEDALRILRLFRFASVLGFEIEEKTLCAALKYAYELESVSGERIMAELSKAVCGKNTEVFSTLLQNGGLKFLNIKYIPDFKKLQQLNFNQNIALFTFLYNSCEKGDLISSLELLKPSNALKDYFLKFSRLLELPLPSEKSHIKKMLTIAEKQIVSDYFAYISVFYDCDKNLLEIMLEESLKEPYLISHLEINGNDLKKMGFEGERIGEILTTLQEKVIENPKLNQKDLLINLIT
ncbi:MAG: CCA tRNA nucleotidyltransferase [Ruminococcaceae bacterium]|nr:CCA tRNA nucleotidyltransferase [Oscillospiraceae bacterium]